MRMRRRDLPFPKHWKMYIVIKLVLIALGLALAFRYMGWW